MKHIAAQLLELIDSYRASLEKLSPTSLDDRPAPGKWSGKEILGHLIDSAQTNIRRMVIARYEDQPLIVYQQDEWVKAGDYHNRSLRELIRLWYLLNRQMAAVINIMDDTAAARLCLTPEPHTLQWLATDYIKHLQHHMHQVLALEPVAYP
jgi:hypothetical protein